MKITPGVEAALLLADAEFAFGVMDVSDAIMTNVPAVCYIFLGSPVKTVIGNNHSIRERVRYFLDDCQNGWF